MADIYTIGGDFLAYGSVRAFTNPRYKPTGGVDVGFALTYSEAFVPSTGAIRLANANSVWQFGLKNTATGAIYWVKNGSANGDITQCPAGNYVVVCKSKYDMGQSTVERPRIRFGGTLTLR